MLVNVYHINDDLFEEDMELYKKLEFGDFEGSPETIKENSSLIARIEVDSLESAFKFTQNGIHSALDSWEKGPHVERLYRENNRSTKVGDMVEILDNDYFIVDSFGFKKL